MKPDLIGDFAHKGNAFMICQHVYPLRNIRAKNSTGLQQEKKGKGIPREHG